MLVGYRSWLASVTASVVLANGGALSAQDLHGWALDSTAKGLELVGVEQAGIMIRCDLKNVSGKPIVAVDVFAPDESRGIMIAYFDSTIELMPGAIVSLRPDVTKFADDNHTLKIAAIMFADGTSDGLPGWIDLVKARQLGSAFETERIKGLLTTPLVERNVGDADVEALAMRVGGVPPTLEEALASLREVQLQGSSIDDIRAAGKAVLNWFLGGVAGVRENAVRNLSRLRQLPLSVENQVPVRTLSRAAFLTNWQQEYQDLSARQQALRRAIQSNENKDVR
jgi:hypothetical protein